MIKLFISFSHLAFNAGYSILTKTLLTSFDDSVVRHGYVRSYVISLTNFTMIAIVIHNLCAWFR